MTKFFVVFVAILACVVAKRQKLSVVADSAGESTGHISSIAYGGHYSTHGGKKYASAAELTSLAHSSAQQARAAFRNQQTAGFQAAVTAARGYASAADKSHYAAQAALVANRVIVQHLQEHVNYAERQLERERGLFQKFLGAAAAAQDNLQENQRQLAAVTAVLATMQQSTTQSESATALANQALAAQQQMIQDSEQRLARVHEKLNKAMAELQQTELAAHKAEAAANRAQSNAAASAQLAVVNSASSQTDDGSEFHHF